MSPAVTDFLMAELRLAICVAICETSPLAPVIDVYSELAWLAASVSCESSECSVVATVFACWYRA